MKNKTVGVLTPESWRVEKIAVVGAGIVGVPMAALLAHARLRINTEEPARVMVIQRNSPTSGWKVAAINSGRSPIGGIEPDLDRIVEDSVSEGLLSASHDYSEVRDADVILVCVQTDRKGFAPDYGPLYEALHSIARELKDRPDGKNPLVVFESTLAPSSMTTLIRSHFREYGLEDGRDIWLGNSPNRVMPGHLVERIRSSDKIAGGLNPLTPRLIRSLYTSVVTEGTLLLANSLTAELVKTLENAYRDVRIAYAAEIVRNCDAHDINFYRVREEVNRRLSWSDGAAVDPNAVPSGGLLIPTIGVGGHCLPKDGILLLWRALEDGRDLSHSLILESRRINDESPAATVRLAERYFGALTAKRIALVGVSYRFNSEDTRNSPALVLARLLLQQGNDVILHDPYVRPDDANLKAFGLETRLTRDLAVALEKAELVFFCTAHRLYEDEIEGILRLSPRSEGIFDGCNLFETSRFADAGPRYTGIGRGRKAPPEALVRFVQEGFLAVERGFANEIQNFIDFANGRFAADEYNRVDYREVKRMAGTCVTGCRLEDPGPVGRVPSYENFPIRLLECLRA